MGSTIQLRSRMDGTGNSQSVFDAATGETISRYSAITLEDEFLYPVATIPTQGAPAIGYPWVKRTVQTAGTPTVVITTSAAGGTVRCALDATSEKQEASFYANDQLVWDMTKSAMFEARIANHVLPTGVVEMVFGLQSAWIDGPDNASFYAEFQQSASGVVNMRTQDGVNAISKATTVTMVVDAFHNFRIDATTPTNVRFFIDGVEVSTPGQLSFAATGSNAILQPYISVYKASGVGVGTVDIDMIQLGMNRS
jgi:hypothetical protein